MNTYITSSYQFHIFSYETFFTYLNLFIILIGWNLCTSPRLSSSYGNNFWECCTALRCDKAGARPGCCKHEMWIQCSI